MFRTFFLLRENLAGHRKVRRPSFIYLPAAAGIRKSLLSAASVAGSRP
jgi:hypothetical protein